MRVTRILGIVGRPSGTACFGLFGQQVSWLCSYKGSMRAILFPAPGLLARDI